MSATVDSFAYTRYFASRTPRGVEPAPAIAMQGRTYRVIDFCLDDIKHVGEVHKAFVKKRADLFQIWGEREVGWLKVRVKEVLRYYHIQTAT